MTPPSRRTAGPPKRLSSRTSVPSITRRFLTQAECETIAQRAAELVKADSSLRLLVDTWWSAELRWARNRISLSSERRDNDLTIVRSLPGASAEVKTNQLDDASLEGASREAERELHGARVDPEDLMEPPPRFDYLKPAIWSEETFQLPMPDCAKAAIAAVAPAERAGMLSAGYIEVRAAAFAAIDTRFSRTLYAPYTTAQCSMTVRDPRGTGSGWAGLSSYDWGRIDCQSLAARALEKCLASRNPVAIEPGRYTVVLEPQAVHELVQHVIRALGRPAAELPSSADPFHLRGVDSKLGLKVIDERVTIGHDPMHPDLGVLPFTVEGEPTLPVTWIDRGVLTNLAYSRSYALQWLHENSPATLRMAYHMSGGASTVDDLVRSTRRGLLVTRFSNVRLIDDAALLLTGVTRDGLWLIEDGKVSKAVKNLRFVESPLFVLNAIDELGMPERVFSPGAPAIVPSLKARDFSFTTIIDAV